LRLYDIFKSLDKDCDKFKHYFSIYEKHFEKYVGTPVRLLEIGVQNGGSLEMWKKYFGPEAEIFGIDIDENCKKFEEDNITIEIGDASKREFWEAHPELTDFDIIIDDASHHCSDQIETLNITYLDRLKDNAIYWCEDTHSSYFPDFGGSYKNKGGYSNENSFIEYAKNIIDIIHYYYLFSHNLKLKYRNIYPIDIPDNLKIFIEACNAVHFYDSIVVLEKSRKKPLHRVTKTKKGILSTRFNQ
jgi:hypothetical protein